MGRKLRMFLACFAWLVAAAATAQTTRATAELTEAAENPPTGSSGYGVAAVEFDIGAHMLKIHVDFLDLVGTTQSAALHCCVADGGNLMAATAPLASLPLKVTRGSTEPKLEVIDTSVAANWNKDFLGAGTTADAETRLAAGLASGTAYLSIRTSSFPNGEIRGVLKTDPGARFFGGINTRQRLLGTQDFTCSDQSDRCLFPVYARTYGTSVLFCEARIDFREIKVPKHAVSGRKIRAIWLIVNGELGDQTDYRFAPSLGVDIGPTTAGDAFDPAKDFNGPGDDNTDRRRFKWVSVHARTNLAFTYKINVERWDPTDSRWKPCTQVDPTISNR